MIYPLLREVHYRQIFELYIQIRFYASLDLAEKERYAEKIYAIGCIDYLNKLSILKDRAQIASGYNEIVDLLSLCN